MRSLWRSAVALGTAPWLVLSSAVAPQHIHEADLRHSNAVVHRHVAQHDDDHDHDGAEIEHGAGRVFWLGDVGIGQSAYELAVAESIDAAHLQTNLFPRSWIVTATLDGAPSHGPPRSCLSLRAPPSLSI
jgi:hypothetical protein